MKGITENVCIFVFHALHAKFILSLLNNKSQSHLDFYLNSLYRLQKQTCLCLVDLAV